jgi:glycosyltransferase involved in cell wall biosynthesis
MIDVTVLIPQRDAGELLKWHIAALTRQLAQLDKSFEIIVVDDASCPQTMRQLHELLTENPPLRVIRLHKPSGISGAITKGISAAKGNVIVTTEAGRRFDVSQTKDLLDGLVRADFVSGKPQRKGWEKLRQRLTRIPRQALLGLEVHDTDCVFWAARREAIENIELGRGMYRFLPTFVTMRGYRVAEIPVETSDQPQPLHEPRLRLNDLLAMRWLQRQSQRPIGVELFAASPQLSAVGGSISHASSPNETTPLSARKSA